MEHHFICDVCGEDIQSGLIHHVLIHIRDLRSEVKKLG